MSYKIFLDRKALKFINSQEHTQKIRLLSAINKLPEIGDIKPLRGHTNVFRLRVGNYRIIYTVKNVELVVRVIDAGNRGQIYNRL